jgi:signal transducer and activator of transcription 5B
MREACFIQKLDALKCQIKSLLCSLINGSFIVEEQPQVMRTKIYFKATVRLLVGRVFNVCSQKAKVTVCFINEKQTIRMMDTQTQIPLKELQTNKIQNSTELLGVKPETGHCSVHFEHMKCLTFERENKPGIESKESVEDQKYCLLFQTVIKLGGNLEFPVWTMSLPVAVVVHTDRDIAWGTILWDNAFPKEDRKGFEVQKKVPWKILAQTLSTKYAQIAGHVLSKDCLRFLARKLTGNMSLEDQNLDTLQITMTQFNKTHLSDRKFTFWRWFFSAMKLGQTLNRLHETVMKKGKKEKDSQTIPSFTQYIQGFISREETEEKLLQKSVGTFLLRYSESTLGRVSIACLVLGPNGPQVENRHPFKASDLKVRKLADIIKKKNKLVYLYPDVPKNEAFDPFFSKTQLPLPGYVLKFKESISEGNHDSPVTEDENETPCKFCSLREGMTSPWMDESDLLEAMQTGEEIPDCQSLDRFLFESQV